MIDLVRANGVLAHLRHAWNEFCDIPGTPHWRKQQFMIHILGAQHDVLVGVIDDDVARKLSLIAWTETPATTAD